MSGFQIPGLGQAKPNETLPPIPADVLVAAASVGDDADMKDAGAVAQPTPAPAAVPTQEQSKTVTEAQQVASVEEDSMVVDQPESPPSLTHALEAALGGLDPPSQPAQLPQPERQTAQPEQPEQPENNAPTEPQEEHPEWEADSSPYESSSESSSDSSSDSDDSDNEAYELLGVEETARLLMEEGGSDDEDAKDGKSLTAAQLRTKNEIAQEVIPKPDITITPEMKIQELGTIQHIVENSILIMAITPGEYQVLDTGSALCTEDRVVIGAVCETIGQVIQPMYTLLFNTEEEIKEMGLSVGTKIFYPVDHVTFVFTQPLRNLKGTDASNLHDEEVGDDEMEFSDDEKEMEYKRSLKNKKRDRRNAGAGGSSRGDRNPHPPKQAQTDGGLNYDDVVDDDGPYKPLARPPGFGSGPASAESYEPAPRSHRGRRGDSRGRGGGRGRGGRGGGRGRPGHQDGYSLPPQSQGPPQPPQAPQAFNPAQGGMPAFPNFGFQMPAWPPQLGQVPPPPPPGWPVQGQAAQGQAGGNPMVNPALFAALLSQMQQQQQQQGQGQGQGQNGQ